MWTFELFEQTKLGDLLDGERTYTKDEILDYAERQGASMAAISLLEDLEEDGEYEAVLDVWPDMPYDDNDFGFDVDEY